MPYSNHVNFLRLFSFLKIPVVYEVALPPPLWGGMESSCWGRIKWGRKKEKGKGKSEEGKEGKVEREEGREMEIKLKNGRVG